MLYQISSSNLLDVLLGHLQEVEDGLGRGAHAHKVLDVALQALGRKEFHRKISF